MIKAIIFDVGGVLVEDPSKKRLKLYSKLTSDSLENVKLKIRKFDRLFSKGKIIAKNFWPKASKKLKIDEKTFRNIWMYSIKISKLNRSVIKLAKKLKSSGYKIAILSNAPYEDFIIPKQYRYLHSIFHPNVFLSFKIGHIKPEKRIFEYTLKNLKIKPEETVFIDDHKYNVDAAKKLGMNAIIFTSFSQLKRDLKKLGVL